jgi:hypothetical protein
MMCDAPLLILQSEPDDSDDPARLAVLKPEVRFGMTVGAGHFTSSRCPSS